MAARLTLPDAVQGARYVVISLTWPGNLDLTGATITGTKRRHRSPDVSALDGTFTPDADQSANPGVFTWDYGAGDVGEAGFFLVQLKATFADFDAIIASSWTVHPLLSATAVAGEAVVGVPQGDADFLAAVEASAGGAADGQVLTADGAGGAAFEAAAAGGAVDSVFGRTGAVVAESGDYTAAQVGAQPSSAKLSALAALTWAANSIVQLTGAATAAVVTLAAHVWTFLQSADATAARAAIGAGTGNGDVTAAAVIADNTIVRGDGGAKGVQSSGVTIDDSNNLVSPGTLGVDVDGNGTNDITIGRYTTLNGRGRITAPDYLVLTVGVIDIATIISDQANWGVPMFPQGAKALGDALKRWAGTYSTVFDGYSNGGGFKTWAAAAVVGTPQTVIANGAGDVTLVLSGTFTVSDGAGNVAGGVITATAPSGTFNLYDDGGTNTCQLQVAADGSVVVVRTAGARTYAVNLCLNWM